ncbi:MAG: cellulase family glycosylhydrolase [Sphaerochaetaceae bacterium]|nr:cellulase family glycosylhydrolase [Sphaerochaetaceae bacterium]
MEQLKVIGNLVCTPTGKQMFLRGTCIGGWMNMEDFINGYSGTESGIRKHVAKVLGASKSEYFFQKLLDNFCTEDDIIFIKSLGATCIRVPLNYRHFEDDDRPFEYKESGFSRLDILLHICEKHELYVILDMHAVQGWQNCHWHSDNERGVSMFWTHPHFQERLARLWVEIALRYRDRSVIAGYELMNEPASGTPNGDHPFDFFDQYHSNWPLVNQVYRYLVDMIRSVDNKHIIFLEGDRYGRYFSGMEAPFDDNVIYSNHHYVPPGFGPGKYPGWYGADHEQSYWDRNRYIGEITSSEGFAYAGKYSVPLLVGEFGAQYHGPEEQIADRLRSMNDQLSVYSELGLHWTTWTYKDTGIMGWVTLDNDSEYMKLITPIQAMKKVLGSENFTALYAECPGRDLAKHLSDLIADVSGEQYNKRSNAFCFNYAALTGYAAAVLQPAYARCFTGLSEDDIDRIMEAFHFKNCKINSKYVELLKTYLQG